MKSQNADTKLKYRYEVTTSGGAALASSEREYVAGFLAGRLAEADRDMELIITNVETGEILLHRNDPANV